LEEGCLSRLHTRVAGWHIDVSGARTSASGGCDFVGCDNVRISARSLEVDEADVSTDVREETFMRSLR